MAQTQIYTRKAQIHVVEESSQDTYLAPAGDGTGMLLGEVAEVPMTIDSPNYEQLTTRTDWLTMDDIPGPASATINFRAALRGSGDAGDVEPEYTEALKACGYEVTPSAGTSHTYTPLSTFDGAGGNPGPSYSVSILENGIRWAISGAFGNVVFSAASGEPGFMDFTFTGQYQAVADDALEVPTYQAVTPPQFLGATFTQFGNTPKGIENFSLDTGNTIVIGRDANETSGIYGSRVTGRRSTGSLDLEMTLVDTFDHFGGWRAGTTGSITTGTIGGSVNNQWALTVARAVRRAPEIQNRDGIRTLSIPFSVTSAATDVEGTNADISLVIT